MRIFVTGAAGFIGRHLVPELQEHGHDVIAVDLPDGDITVTGVAQRLISDARPDVVLHLAAAVSRVLCEDDRLNTIAVNAYGTTMVAEAASNVGARLVYTSTSEVYGDHGTAWCDETTPLRVSHNLYGASKYWGEQVAQLYAPEGLQIIRPTMPFGPTMPVGRGCCALLNFMWWAQNGEDLHVHRNAARSWCWIGDLVRGFRYVIERGEQASSAAESERGVGVYNVGRDDNELSMVDCAKLAIEIVGASPEQLKEFDPPFNQTAIKRLSTKKLFDLGFTPEVELEDGMRRTFAAGFNQDKTIVTNAVGSS